MNSAPQSSSTPPASASLPASSRANPWVRFVLMLVLFTVVMLALLRVFVPQAVPSLFSDVKQRAVRRDQAIVNIKWIYDALYVYSRDHGNMYPSTLDPLILPGANGRTYFGESRTVPLDPWGRAFLYDPPRPGHPGPRVYSLGADAQPGGEGENADVDSDRLELER